jgi:hypothetical protein
LPDFSLDRYSFGNQGFLGGTQGWGYQDFAAGAITGTAVTLSDNENGDYLSFSSGGVVNGSAVIVRTPTTDYTETTKKVYTGATAILSSAVEVTAHTSNTSVTLSGIPHASWPCRIYYLYNYTSGIPVNYTVPPKSITSFLVSELQAMLITEQELTGGTKTASFASLTAATADINGGTIDGTVIGGATPAAGSFVAGTFSDYIDIDESSIPGTPAANVMRLYAESIQGFPFLSFKDDGGMVRKLVRDSVILVYNDSGSTIAASRIVYASGSSGDVPTIALAKADSAATMPAIGVTIEGIANGAFGRAIQVGLLENVNTLAYSAGDVLYVSENTAGVPTITAPTWPNLRQEIGTVLVDSATVGSIQIVARSVYDDSIIDHDGLRNFVANEHIDHTGVILTAGTGLTGGGDISVSRTFNVNYNTDNLKITSTELNTIQDIDAGADVTFGSLTLADAQNVGSDLVPTSPNTYHLGLLNYEWASIRIGTATDQKRILIQAGTNHAEFVPQSGGVEWNGADHYEVGNINSSGTITTSGTLSSTGDFSVDNISIDGNTISATSGNVELSSKLDLNGNELFGVLQITSNAGAIQVSGSVSIEDILLPGVNNSKDLGNPTYKWKDLWIAGSFQDGTNSLTLANIQDAYDKKVDTWGDGLEFAAGY